RWRPAFRGAPSWVPPAAYRCRRSGLANKRKEAGAFSRGGSVPQGNRYMLAPDRSQSGTLLTAPVEPADSDRSGRGVLLARPGGRHARRERTMTSDPQKGQHLPPTGAALAGDGLASAMQALVVEDNEVERAVLTYLLT